MFYSNKNIILLFNSIWVLPGIVPYIILQVVLSLKNIDSVHTWKSIMANDENIYSVQNIPQRLLLFEITDLARHLWIYGNIYGYGTRKGIKFGIHGRLLKKMIWAHCQNEV